jgi:hypothetical protein
MGLVASGQISKQIAADLGISEITIKLHRAQAMQRCGPNLLPTWSEWLRNLGFQPQGFSKPIPTYNRKSFLHNDIVSHANGAFSNDAVGNGR